MSEDENWFERIWEHREEVLYPSLFGKQSRGIFPIPAEMITGTFKQESLDARWLHHGVFEFAPSPTRNSWLYVTSGMSNDWNSAAPDPRTPSGIGCEFVFETPCQSDWAILKLLHVMTFHILLCHGRYPGKEPLGIDDRIPLGGAIREGSVITQLMLAPPSGFAAEALLESGEVVFCQVVGISDAEASYARARGGEALVERLQAAGFFPITDPDRDELPE
jgi:hypothetical protein